MKAFLVSWYASGYCGTFRYLVVANNLDEAKKIWSKFVDENKDVEYSWRKAEKGVKNHYGGYITWKDNGESDKAEGCYKMENVSTYDGSDHLRD